METIAIDTRPAETARILALYPLAFPEEDLCDLVAALLALDTLSLSVSTGEEVTGHVLFSPAGDGAALLGPLAVHPSHQRRGIGSALVRAGLAELARRGTAHVFLLGSPRYYGRFGFAAEHRVSPPYTQPEIWAGAWQSLSLDGTQPAEGPLPLPQPWMRRTYWQP